MVDSGGGTIAFPRAAAVVTGQADVADWILERLGRPELAALLGAERQLSTGCTGGFWLVLPSAAAWRPPRRLRRRRVVRHGRQGSCLGRVRLDRDRFAVVEHL